jgi:phage terminase small subunit
MEKLEERSGAVPLKNQRHEAFCQAYAGKAFGFAGNAYREAGYHTRTDAAADSNGWKLLRKTEISSRVAFLREERRKQLAIDATRILELRLQIAYSDAFPSDKLAALRDVERSLGLQTPEKHEIAVMAYLVSSDEG